ncbi:MAG TPA: LytR C-terminal domain-containing protein [Jatrophihabitantaceae bacterium]|jgi:hypothetical protein
MTAPERRRPLPALAFIGALSLLTALVWFRVLHRSDGTPPATTSSSTHSACPSPSPSSSTPPAPPTVLPVSHKVSVIVLNSTNRNGIAGATTKVLRKDGFVTGKATDDSQSYGGHGQIKQVAEIRYAPSQLPGATLLSYYFPQAKLVPLDSAKARIYVALGNKFKKVAAKKAVHRALTRDHVALKHRKVTVHVPHPTKTC